MFHPSSPKEFLKSYKTTAISYKPAFRLVALPGSMLRIFSADTVEVEMRILLLEWYNI